MNSQELSKKELTQEAAKELAKRELARRKLSSFIHYNFSDYKENWHHRIIIEALEQVERGEITRLMILTPPRHGKSELASVQFPAWYLGRNPERSIIVSSYAFELAVDFGRKARNLVKSQEFINVFEEIGLAEDSKAVGKWHTTKEGLYIAVGVGGAITGRGANLFVIDDPVKGRDEAESPQMLDKKWEWYQAVARTRLTPGGAIVLMMTRWQDGDLAGRILNSEGGKEWKVIKLKAIAEEDEEFRKKGEALWPGMYNLENLMVVKRDIGLYNWSALYQQEPMMSETQVFKQEMFQERDFMEVLKLNTRRFLTIDPAPTKTEDSDYIGVCENYVDSENKWNLRAYRIRMNPKSLIDLLFKLKRDMNFEMVGIEQGMYQDVLKPFLDDEMRKRNIFFNVQELKHEQAKKELRIRGLIPRYESKSIYHIKGECKDLEEELLRFPRGLTDDVMDAAAYQSQIASKPAEENPEEFSIYGGSQSFK
jgi:hypothetical protein